VRELGYHGAVDARELKVGPEVELPHAGPDAPVHRARVDRPAHGRHHHRAVDAFGVDLGGHVVHANFAVDAVRTDFDAFRHAHVKLHPDLVLAAMAVVTAAISIFITVRVFAP